MTITNTIMFIMTTWS